MPFWHDWNKAFRWIPFHHQKAAFIPIMLFADLNNGRMRWISTGFVETLFRCCAPLFLVLFFFLFFNSRSLQTLCDDCDSTSFARFDATWFEVHFVWFLSLSPFISVSFLVLFVVYFLLFRFFLAFISHSVSGLLYHRSTDRVFAHATLAYFLNEIANIFECA